ncbi:hypothetical protein [Corynebacterium sp. LaCa101]|uniref:hypothetical protein n=1 Tax=Corynebacterium sp. LaCa101 TaxID=3391422 RepID=UPI00398A05A4
MLNLSIPSYLVPVYQILEGVRVRTVPTGPETKGDMPKTNSYFPGCSAWKMQVSLVMSEEEGAGGALEREIRRQSITVWAPERPKVEADDIVMFQGVMAGAVDGSVFLQATGVEKLEDTDELL